MQEYKWLQVILKDDITNVSCFDMILVFHLTKILSCIWKRFTESKKICSRMIHKPILTNRCVYALFFIMLMVSSLVSANVSVVQAASNSTNNRKSGAKMTLAEAADKFGLVNATDEGVGGGRSLQYGSCRYYSSGLGVNSYSRARSVCISNLLTVCSGNCPYRQSTTKYWYSGVYLACRCF